MKLSVKNVKTWQGVEGIGFQASLYADGKRIAVVTDDAWGGEYRYDVINQDLFDKANDYAKSLPPVPVFDTTINSNLDIVIDELVNDYEEQKKLKRWCRTITVFKTDECKQGEYYTLKNKYSPHIKAYVLGKHPDARIINEEI